LRVTAVPAAGFSVRVTLYVLRRSSSVRASALRVTVTVLLLPWDTLYEVVDDGHGRPALRLHGAVGTALEQLAAEVGAGAPLRAHLSLSHDPPTAAAVVVLSAPS
jgi:hypothetical protein